MSRKIRFGQLFKQPKGEYFVYSLLVILFIVIGILFVFIIRGERIKNRLLNQYETEQLLFSLSEMVRQNPDLNSIPDKSVLGFGIYNKEGRAIKVFGTAPIHLDFLNINGKGSLFTFNKNRLTVKLVRKLKRRPPVPPHSGGKAEDKILRVDRPGGFYLEINIKNYWLREKILTLSLVMVLLFLGASLFLIQLIYRKNIRYENRLKAQEQLVHLGQAARTLSHEIKNPLGAIQLRTDILKRFTSKEGLDDLRVISEETARLRKLTDRIHDFLKNPLGEPVCIEVNEYLAGLVKRMGGNIVFDRLSGTLSDALSDDKIYILFDRERLRSIIENLIQNAAESCDGGSRIEIKVKTDKKTVTISVLDRGSGISPEIRAHLFEPFFTTKAQGSGIGLSISRRFVEAAGGRIELISRHGGGMEARVTLKREREF
ncbi:MAG: hypothetical protein DRP57_00530 [Spirochaetes bacterium]|nr:MAG: hypothetical protein DRP57_00530 [Spirochaetota bacterium]